MGTKATIKIRAFPYYVDGKDPITGRDVRTEHIATRGQEVELSDVDLERAKKFDAIQTDADASFQESTGEFSVSTANVEQLSEWIREERPTVDETVEAAGGNPIVAQRLIEAEGIATGGEPRTTLVAKLEAVVEGSDPDDVDE